jgi:hypothetical protein
MHFSFVVGELFIRFVVRTYLNNIYSIHKPKDSRRCHIFCANEQTTKVPTNIEVYE